MYKIWPKRYLGDVVLRKTRRRVSFCTIHSMDCSVESSRCAARQLKCYLGECRTPQGIEHIRWGGNVRTREVVTAE